MTLIRGEQRSDNRQEGQCWDEGKEGNNEKGDEENVGCGVRGECGVCEGEGRAGVRNVGNGKEEEERCPEKGEEARNDGEGCVMMVRDV